MRRLVSLFFLFCFSFISFTAEITLSPGWNLITIPLGSVSSPIEAYLQSNLSSGEVLKIWNYDGGWKSYTPGGSNTLSNFEQNRGYWFLMNSGGGTLTYSSSASTQGLELANNGWALASFESSCRS